MTLDKIEYLIDILLEINPERTWDDMFNEILIRGISSFHPMFPRYLDGNIKTIIYRDGKLYQDEDRHGLTPH